MTKPAFDIEDARAIDYLASVRTCSLEEAAKLWHDNLAPIGIGGVKAQCTGRNTHKPAFIGWVRLAMYKDGKYSIGMSEAGNATNIQNSSGLQDGLKMQGNLWPLKKDNGEYYEGKSTSGESYRFRCRRCRRDIQISPEKLGHAAQIMIVNRKKYLDLSLLPFG